MPRLGSNAGRAVAAGVVLCLLPGVAEAKVAVVSFDEVVAKTHPGKRIGKAIAHYYQTRMKVIAKRRAVLEQKEKRLKKAFKQLKAAQTSMKKRVYQRKWAVLEQRYRQLLSEGQKLMRWVSAENAKLQKKRADLLRPLRKRFLLEVAAEAQRRNVVAVMEKASIYHFVAAIDLTPRVIVRVNAATGRKRPRPRP